MSIDRIADKRQALVDFVGDRHNSIKSLIAFRGVIHHFGIERHGYNQLVYARMKTDAIAQNERFYAWDKCCVKGHDDSIANGYQSLWDNGVDVPVQCRRCGRIEM
jgi:hypothetical protein